MEENEEEREETEEKRRKGHVGKKCNCEKKIINYVAKILGSFSNWDLESFQDRLNNIHPWLLEVSKRTPGVV